MELPRRKGAKEAGGSMDRQGEKAFRSRGEEKPIARVLIIDDSPAIGLSLKTFLEDQGYEGLCAHSGREGLEMVRRFRPDVVLLDIMMERPYAGFQVCAQLKSHPDLRRIPVIGISGMGDALGIHYSWEEDREFFNPDAYLEKPIDLEQLLATIRDLLPAQ